MPIAAATRFTPNSELATRTGLVVNWQSPEDLVHDDHGYHEYLMQDEKPMLWGINTELIPALGDLGVRPTVITFAWNDKPNYNYHPDKDEILVPPPMNHRGAVRTVIDGSLNGNMEPPRIRIELNTHVIAEKARLKTQPPKTQNHDAPFAHTALGITNGLLAQQLLRSTWILQAAKAYKSPAEILEGSRHADSKLAIGVVSKLAAISLCALEESVFATEQLATYVNGVPSNPDVFRYVRDTIRYKPIFVPLRVTATAVE